MDDRSFDDLTRALGGAATRRGALAALAGLAAGLGLASREAEARGKRGKGKGAKRKTCQGGCGAGQTCRQGTCVCAGGGASCGNACCAAGQQCEKDACVTPPRRCIDAGAPCSGLHRRCCDGRACASGQGGQHDVACYVPAGGACQTSQDCVYDSNCQEGACIANRRPDAGEGDGDGGDGNDNGNVRCSPEQTACGNTCVDTRTDSANCGACGNACAGQTACNDGVCDNDVCAGSVCDLDYRHVASFGTYGVYTDPNANLGQHDGKLNQPAGIAVSPDGRTAWVSDTFNHRVTVWTEVDGTWTHTASFGAFQNASSGPTDGTMNTPLGLAVNGDGSRVWVTNKWHGRVVEWTKVAGTWTHTASFGTPGDGSGQTDGKLKFPSDVFVDAAGTTAWVADMYNNRIAVWTRGGVGWTHTSSFRVNEWPSSVFVDPSGETAWFAKWVDGVQVGTRSGADWNLGASLGINGTGPLSQTDGQILNATGLAANPTGTVFRVADAGLHRVVVWTKGETAWAHRASFGVPTTLPLGQDDGQLNGPRDLATSADGRTVWVADFENSRITVWTV